MKTEERMDRRLLWPGDWWQTDSPYDSSATFGDLHTIFISEQ